MAFNNLIKNAAKANDPKSVVSQVKKMLNHFETYNFLDLKNSKSKFGFHTEILKQTLKSEWLFTNTINCDHPVFQFQSLTNESDYINAFQKALSFAQTVPFNFVEVDLFDKEVTSKSSVDVSNPVDTIKDLFANCCGIKLKNQIICSPANSLEIFHKQIRERKIWWRQISAWPERFHNTEIVTNSKNKSQCVEVKAGFPWGDETVERIMYIPEVLHCKDKFFEIKTKNKAFTPQVILCESLLDRTALTFICDAFEGINEETSRDILRFNKKLAPYKVAFAATEHPESSQNLKDLAYLLSKKIKKCGISTLLLPGTVCTKDLESLYAQHDAMGIPYTIILNESTLKDGIMYIRSRDTTLNEDSHVSLIVSHIEKLFNFQKS